MIVHSALTLTTRVRRYGPKPRGQTLVNGFEPELKSYAWSPSLHFQRLTTGLTPCGATVGLEQHVTTK